MSFFKYLLLLLVISIDDSEGNGILGDFVNFKKTYPEIEIEEKCASDLEWLKNGIDNSEIWALMVQDVSGKHPSGFIWGNNFWLGMRDSCRLLNKPPKIHLRDTSLNSRLIKNVTDIASEIAVEYRMFYVNHSSEIQFDTGIFEFYGLHIGLCFPKNCSSSDVDVMSKNVFRDSKIGMSTAVGKLTYVRSKLLKVRDNFFGDTNVILLLTVFVVMILLIAIGSYKVSRESNQMVINARPRSSFWQLVAVQNNYHLLTDSKSSEMHFQSINGLRTIFMIWVIFGHSFLYALSAIDNMRFAYSSIDSPAFKFMYGAIIVVDSFFVFGGFLMSYSFYEHMAKRKPKHLISYCADKILKRFVRLNPPFIVMMLISVVVGMYIKDSSAFILYEDLEGNCKNYWWRNVLMVQNW